MIFGLMILIGLMGTGAGTAIGFIFRRDFGTSLITSSFFTSGSSSRGFFTSGCSTGFFITGTVSAGTGSPAKPASGLVRTSRKNIALSFSIVVIATDFYVTQRKSRLFLLKLPDKQSCCTDYPGIDLYRSNLQVCCFQQVTAYSGRSVQGIFYALCRMHC